MNYAKNNVAIFKYANQLISGGWCQHTMATDAKGRRVAPYRSDARNFCLVGAIRRSVDDLSLQHKNDAEDTINNILKVLPLLEPLVEADPNSFLLPTFNDAPTTNKSMVRFILNAAIELCKKSS